MKCHITKIYFLTFVLLNFVTISSQAQSYVPEKNNERTIVNPKVEVKAYAFNLKEVHLLDGGPFKNAMEKDAAYLLLLDPNRLLHRFHKNAGLPVKGKVYGGWESEGLSGHTLGHYLSACSMMFTSTGNEEFKKRVDYIVSELAKCQGARGTGYIGAIPGEDSIFEKVARGEIESSGFDLNGGWSPWYTVHKIMAGLSDVYLYCGNEQALQVVTAMADWIYNILKNLTVEQLQQMLKCEFGGMNEVLANIYSFTGNKKYLDLSYKFFDNFVMEPLSKGIDPMPGKHSNTNIPKAIGSARQYELTGRQKDKTIASFFWQTMVHNHTYVIGGNSNYEYCGEPGKLNDRLSDNTCETCNTYNMLKLTRHLFCLQPNSEYADYYERALYNHILASQNPETGMMCYFVPLRMGTQKVFSDSFNTFTCCVGTGMENHSKYAESIYYEGEDGSLFINLFIPSELNWGEKKVKVKQETGFPEDDNTRFTINTESPVTFTMKIRYPGWVKDGVRIKMNNKEFSAIKDENGYLLIDRKWKNDDKVDVNFPLRLYTESMPDNENRISFLYGPIVLAGQLGTQIPDPHYGIPVLLTDNRNINDWLKPVDDHPLIFELTDIVKPLNKVRLIPFYKTYKQYYSVYWDYITNEQWENREKEYAAEKERIKEIEKRTIDYFPVGEKQAELDHNLQASERSYVDEALGRKGREARKDNFFSFDMEVEQNTENILLLTYIGDDKDRKFDVLADGIKIATVEWNGSEPGKFYDKEYSIPAELIKDKQRITIRIEANYGKTAGRIFGCRTVKER